MIKNSFLFALMAMLIMVSSCKNDDLLETEGSCKEHCRRHQH